MDQTHHEMHPCYRRGRLVDVVPTLAVGRRARKWFGENRRPPSFHSSFTTLVLSFASAMPCAAEDATAIGAPTFPAACVEYTAEYMGCLNYGEPAEAQSRKIRGNADYVAVPSQIPSRPGTTVNGMPDTPSLRPVARQ